MNSQTTLWPLAFALALAVGESKGSTLPDGNAANFFKPGSLATALRPAPNTANDSTEQRSAPTLIQTTQWLNWFNCFNGVWRRC